MTWRFLHLVKILEDDVYAVDYLSVVLDLRQSKKDPGFQLYISPVPQNG